MTCCVCCFFLDHTCKAPSVGASFPKDRAHTEHPKGRHTLCSPMQNALSFFAALTHLPVDLFSCVSYSFFTGTPNHQSLRKRDFPPYQHFFFFMKENQQLNVRPFLSYLMILGMNIWVVSKYFV